MRIGTHDVGPHAPLFVVAELGLNHDGSVARARSLVDAAAEAGASAIKLQTLSAARLVAARCPAPAHVGARSLREFFARFELDEKAHRAIFRRARRRGLAVMSTPFSEDAVDLLETLDCDAYKIASGDLTYHRLIARAARTGRPLVISTGMGDLADVAGAVAAARGAGAEQIVLLHCVSAYPVPAGSENLRAIATLAREFGVPVGLSDHGTDPMAIVIATALGAVLYEKHLALEGDRGVDAAVSATPSGLAALVRSARRARRALGDGRRVCSPAEAPNRPASRRGLFAARDLRPGDVVTADAVAALRPAEGLDVRCWSDLVGRPVTRHVRAGAPFLSRDVAPAARGRRRAAA